MSLRARFRRAGLDRFTATAYVVAVGYAVIVATPLYFLVVSSFKSNAEIVNGPLALPSHVSFDKYVQTQDAIDIIRALAISAVVTGVSLCLTILLAYPAAYAIARVRTRWNQLAEAYFGLGFLIPAFALLVPVFLAIAMIGLLNNPLALILFYPATGLPIAVLILVRYIQTIPVDLDESAAVDGANALEVIRRIIVPLSVPGMVTVAVLNFVGYWNEFLFALVILNTQSRTVQVAVPLLRATRTPDYGLVAAGAIISIVPVFLVFVLLQERIENAFLGGALKG